MFRWVENPRDARDAVRRRAFPQLGPLGAQQVVDLLGTPGPIGTGGVASSAWSLVGGRECHPGRESPRSRVARVEGSLSRPRSGRSAGGSRPAPGRATGSSSCLTPIRLAPPGGVHGPGLRGRSASTRRRLDSGTVSPAGSVRQPTVCVPHSEAPRHGESTRTWAASPRRLAGAAEDLRGVTRQGSARRLRGRRGAQGMVLTRVEPGRGSRRSRTEADACGQPPWRTATDRRCAQEVWVPSSEPRSAVVVLVLPSRR